MNINWNVVKKWLPVLVAAIIAGADELFDQENDEKIEELENRINQLERKKV